MKILFLHLSDAHFRKDTNFSDINIRAMVKGLKQIDSFDECVLVFSGDVVHSGEKDQYITAGCFIGSLIKEIKNNCLSDKRIYTLITPGNHDNLAANPDRNVSELNSYYASSYETDHHFYEDLKQLNNFYEFAKKNGCFNKGKVVDVKPVKFGKFTIKVNLINTAPFSLLCTGNEDKGLHYIPKKEIDKLNYDLHENYTISIIHHGPEWFSDDSKHELYNKLYETSDLIFTGHEHFSLSQSKIVNDQYKVVVSSGLALYGTETEHGFNTLILDTENHSLVGHRFVQKGDIYKPVKNIESDGIVFRGKYKFTHTQKFAKYLETDIDERAGDRYLDYFVFPSLEAKNINDDMKNFSVSTEDKFLEIFSLKRKISIEGGSRAGKTTLAKYLCRILAENYVPIYLEDQDFSPKDNNKVIKYAFAEQYGDNADIDAFWQLDDNKRVLIVDGYDKIKKEKWTAFLKDEEHKFGHIIFFGGVDWNLNIKEKTVEELSENKIFYMKICPFYYAKREKLIEKICSNSQESKVTNITENIRRINEDITDQIRYFQLNPDFIHQYVDYYLSFPYNKSPKESNVFSRVFEANITFRLAKYAGNENVDELMIALDYVAHHIHFNKKYPLPTEEFEQVVAAYNEEYDNNLKAKYVYDVGIKANVIREVPDKFGIEFCDENLLAYFTALHLNRIFNEGRGADELKYILDNICFQPNGDIVLFLSYITSNVQILNPIAESLFNHMKDWVELSLDTDNIGYLSKLSFPERPKLPDSNAKKKLKEEKTNIEKEFVENHKQDSESLYSYDESKVNSFENKISKSLSYLELVAKILPNFRHMLKAEEKQAIVNMLYIYPNKLLYFMLKDIDANYDRIINDILDRVPKTKKGKLVTKDMITKVLQNQSIAYILSIYDFIASTAVNGKTINDLNKFNYSHNTNYKLQNLLMEESAGNLYEFSKKAVELHKNHKLSITDQMVMLIVRKYFLCHDDPLVGEAQHLIDMIFENDNEQKKMLRMSHAHNKIVKK